jgi:uncharacterized protein YgiM (DUF1202 family)
MAVTKAQLVVWALISGLSVWGYTALSRVKLPDAMTTSQPSALAATMELQVATAVSARPAAAVTGVLPDTVPMFPFPDDLIPAATSEAPAPAVVGSFGEIPGSAIPQISTVGGELAPITVTDVAAAAEPAPLPSEEPRVVAEAATEEPPIPMPGRPVVAQPVKAVPLSEVKTLYVVADALNVRATPSTSGPVLQKLPQGFAVAAREQANEWIGFLMRDGSTGWMRTDYLSDTMPPPPANSSPIRVWTEPLNLMM